MKVTLCPKRKSLPTAPLGIERDRHAEPKLTRSQKKLRREQAKAFRQAVFAAKKPKR